MGQKKDFYINGLAATEKVSVKPIVDVIPSAGPKEFTVGDITKHSKVICAYTIDRGGTYEVGVLQMTNADDDKVDRVGGIDDIGVMVAKALDGNNINITFLDLIGAGDVDVTLDIKTENK